MTGVYAETAYVFRHALVRGAAYELQLPTDRAHLHHLTVLVGLALWDKSDAELAPYAAELADHAAQAEGGDGMSAIEARLLKLGSRECMARARNEEALKLLTRLSDHVGVEPAARLEACMEAAQISERMGRLAPAMELLQRILDSPVVKPALRLRALCLRGVMIAESGGLERGVAALEDAFEQSKAQGEAAMCAEALASVGKFCGAMGDKVRAEQALKLALDYANQVSIPALKVRVLGTLGGLFQTQSRQDEAQSYFGQALALAEQTDNPGGAATAKASLALIARQRGRLQEAEDGFIAAAAEFRRVGNMGNLAAVRNFLANLYVDSGKIAAGIEVFDEVIALCEESGWTAMSALYRGNRALALQRLGDFPGAIAELEEAIRLARAAADRAVETTHMANLGSVLDNCGRRAEAEELYVRTLALCRETGNRRFEGLTLKNLAGMFHETGRLGRASAALDLAGEILTPANDAMMALYVAFQRVTLGMQTGEPPAQLETMCNPFRGSGTPLAYEISMIGTLDVRLRVLAGRPQQECRELFERLCARANAAGLAHDQQVYGHLDGCRALLDEVEAEPSPRVFCGFTAAELAPRLRLALLDRMQQLQPEQYERLRGDQRLMAAMMDKTSGVGIPDWRDTTAP